MPLNTTICHVIKGDQILLKYGTRGVARGKWNGPGGKIDSKETPEECAKRELFEETGIRAGKLLYHGTLSFHMDGGTELTILNHLFSTEDFSGEAKSTEEGEVKWFDQKDIPYQDMFPDDAFWLPLMLDKIRFDAEFYFDAENKKILKYNINIKN